MIIDWWGYSVFSKRVLNRVARENGWRVIQEKNWFILRTGSDGHCVARQEKELLPLAIVLGMSLEQFLGRLELELMKGRKVKGIRCQDGVMVHPQALAPAVARLVPKAKLERSLKRWLATHS